MNNVPGSPFLMLLCLLYLTVRCCLTETISCFKIARTPSSLRGLNKIFPKNVNVFGVNVVATNSVSDDKILHAANVLAQYLDNDQDGQVDDADVVAQLKNRKASIIMVRNDRELSRLENRIFGSHYVNDNYVLQDLHDVETIPDSKALQNGGTNEQFDASLEEILHLVSGTGYENVYPDLSISKVSLLSKAMSKAIGDCGNAYSNTLKWPKCNGIYHYDDETCDRECLVVEYFYWALTSVLGAQAYGTRCQQIANEWEACTRQQVASNDPAVYNIITDAKYNLPTNLPNGKYQGCGKGEIVG